MWCRVLAAAAMASVLGPAPALAQTPPADGSWRCTAPAELLSLGAPLPLTRARLERRQSLRILALGSSSTQGYGATRPEASYPAQLAVQLSRRRPFNELTVVNAGVGGDTAVLMRARLEREVASAAPDLVVWQTGANDAIRGVDLDAFRAAITDGVQWLRERRIEVILMPPQFAPVVNRSPEKERYIEAMRAIARDLRIPFFRRYEIMRVAVAADGTTVDALLTRDGLHHTDLGYRCLAAQLADAIEGAGEAVAQTEARQRPNDGGTVRPAVPRRRDDDHAIR